MTNNIKDLLVENRAIEYGNFLLSSGKISNYYVDIKSILTKPSVLVPISSEIAHNYKFDMVAGVAVGGIPLAVSISIITDTPYAIIRSSKKNYGKKDVVIGKVNNKNVILVEDVTTTGKSALYGVKSLREEGAHVDTVVTVFDREDGAADLLKSYGVKLLSLVKSSDL